jgi:hypothetical protein
MAPFYEPPFRRLILKNGRHGLFYVVENRGIVRHALADLRANPDELRQRFCKIVS